MATKLRPIRTTFRAATVKRSDVASAAKAVVVDRDAAIGRFVDRRLDRKASERPRK
jgi:hypothetical protein